MFGPLYSSPDPISLTGKITPRTPTLDHFYAAHHINDAATDLRAILVGHAHYDHLMDVPYFMAKAPQAYVIGSVTTRRLLAGYPGLGPRVVALNEAGHNYVDFTNCASEPVLPGCVTWPGDRGGPYDIPGTQGRIRVRAYCSKHPPQVLHAIHFWPGCLPADLVSPPLRAEDYLEGEVLAYLIDFMQSGQPAFRIYYQDAPVGGQMAQMPGAVIAERAVDLALLCTGNYDAVDRPEGIVSSLQAREVILHHWEDFFDPTHLTLTTIPGLNVDRYQSRVATQLAGHPERVHVLTPGLLRNFPR
ncbi:MAG TPA: hypothetical protein VN461_11520 [Vicinamibacteria bacterium]|nr:hypothetical protein [Vicinamibacteria bacterium]